MFKKLFMLFKIGRKLSTSGAISSVYEIYNPPMAIKILFFIIGFSFETKKNNNNLSPGTKLCNALQGMGTTFIKLGQFLATRPDIIGEDIAKELEKLQDKLPPFQLDVAKNILRKELGKENFDKIKEILNKSSIHYDMLGILTESDIFIDSKSKVTIDELIASNTSWLTNYMSK